MVKNILLIENNRDFGNFLKKGLLEEGFGVKIILNSAQTSKILKVHTPHIIILDWDLNDIHAETLFLELIKNKPGIPVIIMSSSTDPETAVHCFDLGAADFIPKPINIQELVARIRSRLHENEMSPNFEIKDLLLDDYKKVVWRGNKMIRLSPKEFELLKYLIVNRDRVLSREMILSAVWDGREYIGTRIVDVYIGYLREKIDRNSTQSMIKTVRGFGYIAATI